MTLAPKPPDFEKSGLCGICEENAVVVGLLGTDEEPHTTVVWCPSCGNLEISSERIMPGGLPALLAWLVVNHPKLAGPEDKKAPIAESPQPGPIFPPDAVIYKVFNGGSFWTRIKWLLTGR